MIDLCVLNGRSNLVSLMSLAIWVSSCSGSDTSSFLGSGGANSDSGGAGAASATGVGGLLRTGGTSAVGSSGGTHGLGGTNISGGAPSSGGTSGGIGGSMTTGGALNTGGSKSTGGALATGGTTTSTGGSKSTGGALATGGTTTSTGGTKATGGTQATGGSKATGGIPSTGGSSASGGGCAFVPVTPNATQQTRNVLCYLHSIYGNGILSGQEEDNNDNGMNTVYTATGKYPAIRAFDVNNSQAPTQCVTHWNNGGICMFGYHMGINGGTYSTATNINNVLSPGTAENVSFNADLDRVAQYVQPLKTAGGVAILRLFHEAGNGCKWFWWSMGTAAQWQSLFKYAFTYLTATKGLNNVLWIAPLCQYPTAAYNPGAQYIDFGGADNYVSAGDTQPMTSLFQSAQAAFPNMMVALHECGTIPDPDQLKSTGTKWLFFNVWASPFFNSPYNTTAHLQAVYSNPYVITRDRLPSFK